ncbi:MAG: phytanoyl-CoA dioxygenase family protein [Pseudomonadota bacterium]
MLNQSETSLKPHPSNTGFRWPERPTADLKALSPAQVELYNAEGWLHMPALLDTDALTSLREAVDACEAGEPDSVLTMADDYVLTYKKDRMSFSRNLVTRSETVRDAALSPQMAAIMQDLIGPAVRLYWDQAVYKKPGEAREFPFHQDNGYTFVEPQAYVTLWLALNDATEENGCPWVIPGLQHKGTLAHENQPYGLEVEGIKAHKDKVLCCPAKAGDAVIFSSLTPHATGPNTTDTVRKALILQYIPDGARVETGPGQSRALDDPALNPLLPPV